MDSLTEFNLTSIIYGLASLYTLFVVVKQRHTFFDRTVTRADINLTWPVALFVLTPFGVLAHELGHYMMADFYGANNIELHHRGYWGFVSYTGSFDTITSLKISGAGPIVGVGLGYLCLVASVTIPVRMIIRHVLAKFGFLQVFHHLIAYPIFDFFTGMKGDYYNIYTSLPLSGIILVGLIHLVLLGLLVQSWQKAPTRDLLNS